MSFADYEPLMEWFAEADVRDGLHWYTDPHGSGMRFAVPCNDLFDWATADVEPVLPEDTEDLQRALDDMESLGIDPLEIDTEGLALMLWCCRHRGQRPQWPYVNKEAEAVIDLFRQAGPPRDDWPEGQ